MTVAKVHRTSHNIAIDAPAEVVYAIIADATSWPIRFAPTVHVDREEIDSTTERLHIWAIANSEVKNWTSRRELEPGRIRFRQEVSRHPVASMGGEWIVTPEGAGCRLTLLHDFTAVDEDPTNVEWILTATNRNSDTELGNIKQLAENLNHVSDLTFSFEDSVVIKGTVEAVYEFLYNAKLWPDRLPHVVGMTLTEDVPNLQTLKMDTLAKDGSVHTTESIRVCFPSNRLVYKQQVPPSLMSVHTGEWTIEQTPEGVRVTSQHTVVVRETNIAKVLGPEATVDTAKAFIRQAAGGNSMATLTLAKNFVEALLD